MAYRNIRLHPVLRLIYLILRLLVWAGTGLFYRRRLVLGRENLRFDGPAIVIANHPSTLMDVLNSALWVRQEMFYLANYGLFKHPVSNWLFRRLFCIPVKRREDVAEGEARNNDEAFKQSFVHLEKNGVLFIAPEGTSWMNRFVRPLKSGTARIAFGAESSNDWKLEVKIIPVGLCYSAPALFRSDVVVQFGAAVTARDWQQAWLENRGQAVDDLTQHLEDQLKILSLDARDENGEQVIVRLETMLQNEFPVSQKKAVERSRALTGPALNDEDLTIKVNNYFESLGRYGLNDAGVLECRNAGAEGRSLRDVILLIAGLPFFIAGYLFWFLPCFLPWLLNKKMNLYVGYSSTIKILAGLITVPLALYTAYRLGSTACAGHGLALLAVAGLIGLGYFTEWYQDLYRIFRQRQTARALARREPAAFDLLLQSRAQIMQRLQSILPTT